ncbi:MAG: hypothetical protein ACFCUG_12695 [Thiotrichales bacterium]
MYPNQQTRRLLPLFVLLCAPGWALAQTCSREDIEHYLQRGFTHDQVTRLCGNAPAEATTPTTSTPMQVPATTPDAGGRPAPLSAPPPVVTDQGADDLLTLKASIEASDVQVTPEAIVYTLNEECLFHGTENHVGLRDRTCLATTVSIARKDLKVTAVRAPILLVREGQFIVTGDITRSFEGLDRLNRYARAEIESEYPRRVNEINVPFRKRTDLTRLQAAFERLAN